MTTAGNDHDEATGPPARVVAYAPDLIDRSRIQAVAGADVETVDRLDRLAERARSSPLVVVDLGRPGVLDALAGASGTVIGFASHVDRETIDAARAAGVDALARSEFFRRLPELLGRPSP